MYSTCRVHVSRLLVILELYVLNGDRSNSSGGGYTYVRVCGSYVRTRRVLCLYFTHNPLCAFLSKPQYEWDISTHV